MTEKNNRKYGLNDIKYKVIYRLVGKLYISVIISFVQKSESLPCEISLIIYQISVIGHSITIMSVINQSINTHLYSAMCRERIRGA